MRATPTHHQPATTLTPCLAQMWVQPGDADWASITPPPMVTHGAVAQPGSGHAGKDGADATETEEEGEAFDMSKARKRRRLSEAERSVLDDVYAHTPNPKLELRCALAVQLGSTERHIQIWFQNRRVKDRATQSRPALSWSATNTSGISSSSTESEDEDGRSRGRGLLSPPMVDSSDGGDRATLLGKMQRIRESWRADQREIDELQKREVEKMMQAQQSSSLVSSPTVVTSPPQTSLPLPPMARVGSGEDPSQLLTEYFDNERQLEQLRREMEEISQFHGTEILSCCRYTTS